MSTAIISKVDDVGAIVTEIESFLRVRTPYEWVEHALGDLTTLLIDHANCEYKAASMGMALINRYRNRSKLQRLMARLVREEMLHYEQVLVFIERLGIEYRPVTASRYASTLRSAARTAEPGRLTDVLLIGAVVEARSCERFAALHAKLSQNLGKFYHSLLRSEGRHYKDYLALAGETASSEEVEDRLAKFLDLDHYLIESPDREFRFHSGVPEIRVAC